MKKTILILITVITFQTGFTQNIDECNKIVKTTIEAINNHSSEKLEPFLASDFQIAEKSGAIAKMILKQLLSQLSETVISHKIKESITKNDILTLICEIEYKKLGFKKATFVFNSNSKLQELSLLEMKVKTLEKDETKVEVNIKDTITIPFTMAGKLIAVQAQLNGIERTFILDSGNGQALILNSKRISQDTKNQNSQSNLNGVNGNISNLNIKIIEQFDFSGIQLNNQKILTIDLSEMEKSLDTEIYGIIGYNFIKEYDILYDYGKQKITLINPAYFEKYKKDKLINNKLNYIDFEQQTHIPVIKAIIDNKVYLFGIDCGAESNLIDFNLFSQLENNLSNISTDTLSGVDNIKKEVKKGKIKKSFIGGKKFKNIITVFSDISHLNKDDKMKINGLVGYEVLSKQPTLISYKRKQVIFIE